MNKLQISDFSLKDTLECGQTFCWVREGEGYINTDIDGIVYVEQTGDTLFWEASNNDIDIEELLRLKDPIDEIKSAIAKDTFMKESISFASGLRVVNDSFYPCLISFLCSVWSNIPKIRGMVRLIRQNYGPVYKFRGKEFHGMPNPEALSQASANDLRKLGLGWRADFVVQSTEALLNKEIVPERLTRLEYEEARYQIMELHGVGNKVADCVLLFSLGFLEAFPIDVWIERVIKQKYGLFTEAGKSYVRKSKAAREYFGRYAGYAQQYLYHYSRSTFNHTLC